MLRAFADRMLLKATEMDDPKDLPGVEKAVRVAASIERIYYRCDRAERQTPDPRKVEAERATHQRDAIKARVSLASTLEWGEMRQRQLGKWWDAAQTTAQVPVPAPITTPQARPHSPTETPPVQNAIQAAVLPERPELVSDKTPGSLEQTRSGVIDYDGLIKARADMGLPYIPPEGIEDWLHRRPSPP